MTRRLMTVLLTMSALLSMPLLAVDATPGGGGWSQWRGPGRDGSVPSFEAPTAWPAELHLAWEAEVGHSDSGVVVASGMAFTFTRVGESEIVTALDLESGSVVWRSDYAVPFRFMKIVGIHGAGPYATPLVAGDTIYTYGITEVLTAFDLSSGQQRWQRRFAEDYKVAQPFYGNSLSPLFVDGKLIVEAGGGSAGSLIAVDADTGEDVWRLDGDGPAYGSPIVADIDGHRQVVTLTQKRLIGADLESGRLLWETPFEVSAFVTSLTPLIQDSAILISGPKRPLQAFRASAKGKRWSIKELWSNDDIWMDYSSPVMAGASMVGFSVKNKGQLVVVDPTSGDITWASDPRQGENSFLISAGDLVFSTNVDGQLEVLRIQDGQAASLARYEVAQSAVWSHPALLERHILVQDQTHIRLWELRAP